MRIASGMFALALGLMMTGCSAPVDLKQVLHLEDISGGFRDGGIVDGRNKVVPSISFRLRKSTDRSLTPLSLNVAFKKLPPAGVTPAPGSPTEEEWDEAFTASVPFNGNDTGILNFKINAGFTGDAPQSRADILKNTHFQDVRVHIFAKHSSSQWTEIGQYTLPRQLITQ